MFKASDIREPSHAFYYCKSGCEHSYLPYSTKTRKDERTEYEEITALLCSSCLILVSIDDDFHQHMSHIAAASSVQDE